MPGEPPAATRPLPSKPLPPPTRDVAAIKVNTVWYFDTTVSGHYTGWCQHQAGWQCLNQAVRTLTSVTMLCSWARQGTLTVPFTGNFIALCNPAIDLQFHPELQNAAKDKLRPDGCLGPWVAVWPRP